MKHLICYGEITDTNYPLIEIGTREYIAKRLRFWKWHKHNTMGRPVLELWRNRS